MASNFQPDDGWVMPQGHEDQLELGFQIIRNAYTRQTQNLNIELRSLEKISEEKTKTLDNLVTKEQQKKGKMAEIQQRITQLSDENKHLVNTLSQLRKQVARLESLKKAVLSTLQEETSQGLDDPNENFYMQEDFFKTVTPYTLSALQGQPVPVHTHATSQRQLNQNNSTGSLPRTTIPANHNSGGGSSAYGGAGADDSFGAGGMAVDGKQFFRQARGVLSQEDFNVFLGNIKQLNNNRMTNEECLMQAQQIFGPANAHLYNTFEQLLSRHS